MRPRHELTDKPPPEAFAKLWEPLRAFNERIVGDASAHTLAILLREPATDTIIGGLWGRSLWGSMYIDIVFVPEELRGRGIGASLVRQAEQEVIQRWVRAYVDRHLRLPGASVLRKHGLCRVRAPRRSGADLSSFFPHEGCRQDEQIRTRRCCGA